MSHNPPTHLIWPFNLPWAKLRIWSLYHPPKMPPNLALDHPNHNTHLPFSKPTLNPPFLPICTLYTCFKPLLTHSLTPSTNCCKHCLKPHPPHLASEIVSDHHTITALNPCSSSYSISLFGKKSLPLHSILIPPLNHALAYSENTFSSHSLTL